MYVLHIYILQTQKTAQYTKQPQVISEVDMGEPILQVPIDLAHPTDDDIDALEERIHAVEHKAIVEGTRLAVERIRSAAAS